MFTQYWELPCFMAQKGLHIICVKVIIEELLGSNGLGSASLLAQEAL